MDDSGDRAGAAMERSCGDAVEDGSGAADRDAPGGVWDVVVVGAGASAAHAAACTGRRVLLLEKARLPRYKTCGGGIIGPSLDALPNGFQVPVRDRVHAVTFCLNGRLSRTRRSKRMLFALVDRPEFDAALVEAAREAGAVVRTGVAFSRIDQEGPETVAVVLCDGQTLSARAVVGADGSAGRTGVHVGVTLAQVDFGMEAEIPVPPAVAEGWAQRVLIDWGPVPGSYGWVFPKGHTLSVGVIAARGDGAATRRYLKEFIDRLGLAGFEPDVVSGHLTRCRSADSPLSRGRVVVCGDAAGLLEPWTREGISLALRSGRLAGEWAVRIADARDAAVARQRGFDYDLAIEAGLGAEMRVGHRLRRLCERHPGLVHVALAGFRPAWHTFAQFTRGTVTLAQIVGRSPLARFLLFAMGRL